MQKLFAVYIIGNERPTLYTGITNNLPRRLYEHQHELIDGFTKKYHLHKLLYFETAENPMSAIIREKQIKNMSRAEKLALIRTKNPAFRDLSSEVYAS